MSEKPSYASRLEEITQEVLRKAREVYERFARVFPEVELDKIQISKKVMWNERALRNPSEFDGFTLNEIAEAKFAYLYSLQESGKIEGSQFVRLKKFRDRFIGPRVVIEYYESISGHLPYNPSSIYEICSEQGFHDTLERLTDIDFIWKFTASIREARKKHKDEREKDKAEEDEEDEIL